MAERSGRNRAKAVLAIAALGAFATALLSNRWSEEYLRNVVDDSLISMVYARRLATGDGLVFNPGEPIEGYTNFLWTVTLAPIYWLSRLFDGDFVHWAVGTSVLVAALDVVLVVVIGRRLWGDRLLPLALAVGLLVVDNSYTVWAMMALESHYVALWALATLAVWGSRVRHREVFAGLCLAAVPMSRPDGALFVAAFALSEFLAVLAPLFRRDGARCLERLRALSLAGAVFVLVFGAYYAWKWHYYGWPFPNTYYLKVGSSTFDALARGEAYVRAFVDERGGFPLLFLLAVPWIGNPTVRTLLVWVPVHALYVAHVGGDFYSGHRFLVQLLPAIALCVGHAVNGVLELTRRPRVDALLARINVRYALAGLVAVFIWGSLGEQLLLGLKKGPRELEIRPWRMAVDGQRRYMSWLAKVTRPDEYICAGDIGSAGLYANLRVIDYYGVIDSYVAHQDVATLGRGKPGHEKTAPVDYVLSRRPKYIKWGYLPGYFWNDGYYFENRIPLDIGMPGIWVRDDLASTGTIDPAGAIPFDRVPYAGWVTEGEAFERWPSGQGGVVGAEGFFLSSFHPERGDAPTGSLRSAPFRLTGDRMLLRVGGGHDPERLRVSLVVDGERRFSETGTRTDHLGRREWDIRSLEGRSAILELVDEATGPWGHIVVDSIVQWTAIAGPPDKGL